MRSTYLSVTLAVVLLSLAVVSAFAKYPPSEPGIPAIQPPVLLVPSDQISGHLCFHYADGRNVTLAQPPKVTVLATSTTGSITLDALLIPLFRNQTSGCCYTYGINTTLPGFPTGQVSLYIVAGSLTDSYGRPFPSVNTLIGTIMVSPPSSSSPSGVVGSSSPGQASSSPASPGNPPGLYRDAQSTSEEGRAAQPPPNLIPVVLVLLAVAGAALVLVPTRRR
jgi:hypothetical protein